MIRSISSELGVLDIPNYIGEVSMIPFKLSDISTLPREFRKVVEKMISKIPKNGEAYLTVHGKFLKKSKTLRRGAPDRDWETY